MWARVLACVSSYRHSWTLENSTTEWQCQRQHTTLNRQWCWTFSLTKHKIQIFECGKMFMRYSTIYYIYIYLSFSLFFHCRQFHFHFICIAIFILLFYLRSLLAVFLQRNTCWQQFTLLAHLSFVKWMETVTILHCLSCCIINVAKFIVVVLCRRYSTDNFGNFTFVNGTSIRCDCIKGRRIAAETRLRWLFRKVSFSLSSFVFFIPGSFVRLLAHSLSTCRSFFIAIYFFLTFVDVILF